MYRRILAWVLIVVGSLFVGLSAIGIGAIWIYRQPLTDKAMAQLKSVDTELTQAHTALSSGQDELRRTLRIVETAETSVATLKKQLAEAKVLTDQMNGTLSGSLMPGLQSTRDKIHQLRDTLQNLRDSLKALNSVPFLTLDIPGDDFLANIISGVNGIDKQIETVQELTKKASTFISDASYLMGGDFGDTKTRINNLLAIVGEYDKKVSGWQSQLRTVMAALPRWINEAAVGLTLFLLWFGISQFGLVLHGLALQQGVDPFVVLRRIKSPRTVEYVD